MDKCGSHTYPRTHRLLRVVTLRMKYVYELTNLLNPDLTRSPLSQGIDAHRRELTASLGKVTRLGSRSYWVPTHMEAFFYEGTVRDLCEMYDEDPAACT